MTDAEKQIREALAAGPTPGRRFQGRSPHSYCVYDKKCWYEADGSRHGETPNLVVTISPEDAQADAQFIAACSPANMTAILAHVEAQAAEIERLRAALNTCVWALRQPLDDWKGECERKALDEAREALKEQR